MLRVKVRDEFSPSTVDWYNPPKFRSASAADCAMSPGRIVSTIRSPIAPMISGRSGNVLVLNMLKPASKSGKRTRKLL